VSRGEQLEEAAAIACDLLMPGFREKFMRDRQKKAEATREDEGITIEPDPARDVVAVSADACPDCEGEGELKNLRGRLVPCGGCRGSGRAK
jgi:DnaJ-class molecular chaperone